MPLAAERRTIELPQFCVRAGLSSLNNEQRTVEATVSTGVAVLRRDWLTGEKWWERLSMEPDHIRLDRLNSSAPILDTHSGWSLSQQLGVVVERTARVVGKRLAATLRFSKRSDVTPIWNDVMDGIYRNTSLGYQTYRLEDIGKKDGIPVRLATDWEPHEVSMVPMPADVGAQTRDGKPTALHMCVIETRGDDDADRERWLRLARRRWA